jgi:uncharacterized protein (TIGR02145 family)
VNVIRAGTISFSSNTIDGYSFFGVGTYPVGIHQVVLTTTGTKGTYNAGGDVFTISGLASTTQTHTITIANVRLGSSFTTHFNGITNGVSANDALSTYTTGETFNNNTVAQNKIISASACPGTDGTHGTTGIVNVGANTYTTVNINGQCWMSENLNELPNGVAVSATQWRNTSPGDQGYYGYFNTTTTNGSAGWRITEPTAGDGLLYQWSAAMAGSTAERAQGICPRGWHIPSDAEVMYLEHGQGMAISEQIKNNTWRANAANQGAPGNKLRSEGTGQTNASGFSALLSGYRNVDGTFHNIRRDYSYWTSSQQNTTRAFDRFLVTNNRGVYREVGDKARGISVRCLKD